MTGRFPCAGVLVLLLGCTGSARDICEIWTTAWCEKVEECRSPDAVPWLDCKPRNMEWCCEQVDCQTAVPGWVYDKANECAAAYKDVECGVAFIKDGLPEECR